MRKMAVKDEKSISMPRRMENVCFITKILDFFFFFNFRKILRYSETYVERITKNYICI